MRRPRNNRSEAGANEPKRPAAKQSEDLGAATSSNLRKLFAFNAGLAVSSYPDCFAAAAFSDQHERQGAFKGIDNLAEEVLRGRAWLSLGMRRPNRFLRQLRHVLTTRRKWLNSGRRDQFFEDWESIRYEYEVPDGLWLAQQRFLLGWRRTRILKWVSELLEGELLNASGVPTEPCRLGIDAGRLLAAAARMNLSWDHEDLRERVERMAAWRECLSRPASTQYSECASDIVQALAHAETFRLVEPRIWSLIALLQECLRQGSFASDKRHYKDEGREEVLDSYQEKAVLLAEAAIRTPAIDLAEQVRGKPWFVPGMPDSLISLAMTLERRGGTEEAKKLTEMLNDAAPSKIKANTKGNPKWRLWWELWIDDSESKTYRLCSHQEVVRKKTQGKRQKGRRKKSGKAKN